MEMNRLKTIATWILFIFQFKNFHNSHVIIQVLNTTSLCQQFENINHDHDLQMFNILCLIKTRIHHASTNLHKFINSSMYSYISILRGHGLMMMYDILMPLDSFNTLINNGSKYIVATFNINTGKKYILYVCIKFIHV